MNYTALYNLLDFPAGVVPVTKVKEEDIEKLKNYRGYYGDPWDKQVKEVSLLLKLVLNLLVLHYILI